MSIVWVSGVCFLVDWTDVHGTGRTQVSNCNIQQPYGLYTIEPASPTSLESIRLVTLRIKLDTNVSDGEWAHEAGGGGEWLFVVCLFCFFWFRFWSILLYGSLWLCFIYEERFKIFGLRDVRWFWKSYWREDSWGMMMVCSEGLSIIRV